MLARLVWDLCLLLYLPHLGWADPDMRRWRATVWLSLLEFGLLLAVSGWLWLWTGWGFLRFNLRGASMAVMGIIWIVNHVFVFTQPRIEERERDILSLPPSRRRGRLLRAGVAALLLIAVIVLSLVARRAIDSAHRQTAIGVRATRFESAKSAAERPRWWGCARGVRRCTTACSARGSVRRLDVV